MRKALHILCLSAILALTAWSCSREPLSTMEPSGAEVPFELGINMPVGPDTKASMVSGVENTVKVMRLICFDASGLYLGIRTAELLTAIPADANGIQRGTIKGEVPQGTARVHFVANKELPASLPFSAGASERIVMHSEALSSARSEEICYWGYHKTDTPEQMAEWLSPSGANPVANTIYLIRDRARVRLSLSGVTLKSGQTLTWLIHNGRERGYVAPFGNTRETTPRPVWGNTSYYVTGGSFDTGSPYLPITEYTSAGRYSLWTSESENEDNSFVPHGDYIYLFDDTNEQTSDSDGRLKVILKLTDPSLPAAKYPDGKKYLVVIVQAEDSETNEKKPIPIMRNYTYVVTCEGINMDGYATLKDAVEGSQFANAPVEIDRTVLHISDDVGSLEITYKENGVASTHAVRTEPESFDVTFKYDPEDSSTPHSASDFDISWESKKYSSWTIGATTQGSGTDEDKYTVPITLGAIPTQENDVWDDYLVITHKESGLTRYVHVFGIKGFAFVGEPVLERVTGVTYSSANYPVYKLTFTIPGAFADDLYPINVRIATSTLDIYSNDSYSARTGDYGVVVESTSSLEAGTAGTWNATVKSWGYWYEYSIATPVKNENGENQDFTVNLFFKDIRSNLAAGNRPSNVGLYLQLPNFPLQSYSAS